MSMETDQQLENPPGKGTPHTELSSQIPTRAARERRYRPKVATVTTAATAATAPSDAAAKVAQKVSVWNDTAVRISAVVVGLILVVLVLTMLSAQADPAAVFSSFSVRFLSLFIEAAPFLLLGTLVSGFIDTFVSQDHIARLVPRNRFLGVLLGTFVGFVFPVCECGVVPVVRQLYSMRLPAAVGV